MRPRCSRAAWNRYSPISARLLIGIRKGVSNRKAESLESQNSGNDGAPRDSSGFVERRSHQVSARQVRV